jgi:hypothetical protein
MYINVFNYLSASSRFLALIEGGGDDDGCHGVMSKEAFYDFLIKECQVRDRDACRVSKRIRYK